MSTTKTGKKAKGWPFYFTLKGQHAVTMTASSACFCSIACPYCACAHLRFSSSASPLCALAQRTSSLLHGRWPTHLGTRWRTSAHTDDVHNHSEAAFHRRSHKWQSGVSLRRCAEGAEWCGKTATAACVCVEGDGGATWGLSTLFRQTPLAIRRARAGLEGARACVGEAARRCHPSLPCA